MLGGCKMTSVRGSAAGLAGAMLLLTAGCPDTFPGRRLGAAPPDAGPDVPTLVLRQTVDFTSVGMTHLRGWLRFTSGGTRAYVADWGDAAALMTVGVDGQLSEPTKLTTDGACNMSDLRFSPDEQVVFVASYYKWPCNQAVSAFAVQGLGTFGGAALATAWDGATSHQAPDFAESIALHPEGRWLYVGFANNHPTTDVVREDSEIWRVDAASGLSDETGMVTLGPGFVAEVSLAFSPAGDALYAVQYDTGKVSRFHVDAATGALTVGGTATAGNIAEIGPICLKDGKEHVYIGSGADDPVGGVHHLVFNGPIFETSTVSGGSHHPGLQHVRSIVADEDCRYLYAVGDWGGGTMLHILEVDPTTGATTWVSGLDGVAQLRDRNRLTMSSDGRFLYSVTTCSPLACTNEWVIPSLVNVFEIVTPSTELE
jgi:6-phosphogluconolactonase (cycloisomerase 2 family)